MPLDEFGRFLPPSSDFRSSISKALTTTPEHVQRLAALECKVPSYIEPEAFLQDIYERGLEAVLHDFRIAVCRYEYLNSKKGLHAAAKKLGYNRTTFALRLGKMDQRREWFGDYSESSSVSE